MNLFFKIGLLSLFVIAAPFFSLPKSATQESSFRVALQQEITTLDPLCSIDSASISLLYLTQKGLVTWSSSGEISLDLAESYEVSSDQTHYRFVLKEATWSDGSPITAFDFEESWKRALDQPTPNTPIFFVFAHAKEIFEEKIPLNQLGIQATSDRVLEISLEKPYSPFLQLLTTSAFFPYKLDSVTEIPLSSGAYSIQKLTRCNLIELVKRDPSHLGPSLIEFKWVPDEMTALQLFQTSKIDFLGLPYSRIPTDLPESLHEYTCSHELLATYALLMNPAQPGLENQELRKQVSHVLREIQWEDLSDLEISSNTHFLVPGIHPSSMSNPLAQQRDDDQHSQGDEKGEKKELVLLTTMGSLNRKVAQVIHQKLKDSGLHVKIRMMDTKGYYSEMRQGNFDLCITWFSIQYPSPMSVLGRFTNQSFQRQLFPLHDPDFDELYVRALASTDSERTQELLAEAENLLIQKAICVPLFTPSSVAFVSEEWSVGFAASGFVDLLQLTLKAESQDEPELKRETIRKGALGSSF